jgi:hypothetical protein
MKEFEKQADSKVSIEERATARMFLNVYAATRMHMPFSSHPILMQRLGLQGIDVGKHHLHEKAPAFFIRHISEGLHKTLLLDLEKKDGPLSIILHTATDSLGHDFIVVLFRTLEKERPVMYFYKLRQMGVDDELQRVSLPC